MRGKSARDVGSYCHGSAGLFLARGRTAQTDDTERDPSLADHRGAQPQVL